MGEMDEHSKKISSIIEQSGMDGRDVYGLLTNGDFTRYEIELALRNLSGGTAKRVMVGLVNSIAAKTPRRRGLSADWFEAAEEGHAWHRMLNPSIHDRPNTVTPVLPEQEWGAYFNEPCADEDVQDAVILNAALAHPHTDDTALAGMERVFTASADPDGKKFILCSMRLAQNPRTPSSLLNRAVEETHSENYDFMRVLVDNPSLSPKNVEDLWGKYVENPPEWSTLRNDHELKYRIPNHPSAGKFFRLRALVRIKAWGRKEDWERMWMRIKRKRSLL
jgi:hypothetical protein